MDEEHPDRDARMCCSSFCATRVALKTFWCELSRLHRSDHTAWRTTGHVSRPFRWCCARGSVSNNDAVALLIQNTNRHSRQRINGDTERTKEDAAQVIVHF